MVCAGPFANNRWGIVRAGRMEAALVTYIRNVQTPPAYNVGLHSKMASDGRPLFIGQRISTLCLM